MGWRRRFAAGTTGFALLVVGACSADEERSEPDSRPSPTNSTNSTGSAAPDEASTEAPHPISTEALARADLTGDDLRIGPVREETGSFTSYDVSFRSRSTTDGGRRELRISGVLNVPRGEGPFPAVVLAHGYIDPDVYESGQGMTRERGYLAERGFVALHVDYRNHAGSDDDTRVASAVRLGYSADVLNAVQALKESPDLAVDPARVSMVGRSMGGGVMLRAMAAKPGTVHAGVAWASISSLEAENFEHFNAQDTDDAGENARMSRRHGLPDENPRFWRNVSSRPFFDRVSEPVLLVHGRFDDTCPPRWARATQRALQAAGAESELAWFDDGHAFGPQFNAAMDRTIAFLRAGS